MHGQCRREFHARADLLMAVASYTVHRSPRFNARREARSLGNGAVAGHAFRSAYDEGDGEQNVTHRISTIQGQGMPPCWRLMTRPTCTEPILRFSSPLLRRITTRE